MQKKLATAAATAVAAATIIGGIGFGTVAANAAPVTTAASASSTAAQSPLTVNVDSVDTEARTAVLSGTATPGAAIDLTIAETGAGSVVFADADGNWSGTVKDLPSAISKVHVTQFMDGIDSETVDVWVMLPDV
ncbi:hypothetical protein EDF24_2226 [Curtobacterium sp. PhB130]|uniref:hypothetical protein n=1 Tax=unclassified Curtobacterium TaxID=257496 RepID=UPI000F4B9D27|nr:MULTISPECIES: hypothetical protein [unclassified Curtobacterium]ROP64492.1 hypothetical protein EDF55_1138 [Curtobacterium sp. ZW137]ROS74791.1 hypothetical protein EDF24_2226 [Curtobacterium sp. PhB130]